MSQALERVDHRDTIATLQELRRPLCPGSVQRVSVPDLDLVIGNYNAANGDSTAIEQPLMGDQEHPFSFHYSVFVGRHLRSVMLRAGFKSTRSWDPQHCDHHDFEDWASMNIRWGGHEFPTSLNMEAVK